MVSNLSFSLVVTTPALHRLSSAAVAALSAARVDYVPATDEEAAELNRRVIEELNERDRRKRARREVASKCAAVLKAMERLR